MGRKSNKKKLEDYMRRKTADKREQERLAMSKDYQPTQEMANERR